jgi:hypothetical protein
MTEKGELVCAAATGDGFKALNRAQIMPDHVRAFPAVADGYFYARSTDKLFCFDLTKGK